MLVLCETMVQWLALTERRLSVWNPGLPVMQFGCRMRLRVHSLSRHSGLLPQWQDMHVRPTGCRRVSHCGQGDNSVLVPDTTGRASAHCDRECGTSGDMKNRWTDCQVAQLLHLVWNNDALQRYHNTIHLHFQYNSCFNSQNLHSITSPLMASVILMWWRITLSRTWNGFLSAAPLTHGPVSNILIARQTSKRLKGSSRKVLLRHADVAPL